MLFTWREGKAYGKQAGKLGKRREIELESQKKQQKNHKKKNQLRRGEEEGNMERKKTGRQRMIGYSKEIDI